MRKPFVINIIGSGNVARHLAAGWQNKGLVIDKIWSRTAGHAAELAEILGCSVASNPDDVFKECDAVIISITDSALPHFAGQLANMSDIPVFHTSGTQPMSVLSKISREHGVIYPLQTFSKIREVELNQVPFFLEANSEKTMETAQFLAKLLSNKINEIDSDQRMHLHLAAVFVSNFANLMYSVADEMLRNKKMSLEWLHPLMIETAAKATLAKPEAVQTGPARRGDIEIIEKHLRLLKENPEIAAIYKLLSEEILRRYHPEIQ